MKTRLRCMKCLSHGVYVERHEIVTAHYLENVDIYKYECVDCGETKELEWEEV